MTTTDGEFSEEFEEGRRYGLRQVARMVRRYLRIEAPDLVASKIEAEANSDPDKYPNPVRTERERCRQLFLRHLLHAHGPILGDPGVAESVRDALEAIESGAEIDWKLEFVERESGWSLPYIQSIRRTASAPSRTEDILTAIADAIAPSPDPTPTLAPRCSLCEAPVLLRESGFGYRCECNPGFWSNCAYDNLVRIRLAEQQKEPKP